ncbi:hypothetical protein L1887_05710 [Cichorium endivia]|nr:hypothetical protein L1887_05710 [Cichorium endivia]
MENGERFENSFAAELVAAHLRHRNLVPLRGWCVHDDQLLLVYDYMPNRSLDRLLFRRVENTGIAVAPPLIWEKRMKIVKGKDAVDEPPVPAMPVGGHDKNWRHDWVLTTGELPEERYRHRKI